MDKYIDCMAKECCSFSRSFLLFSSFFSKIGFSIDIIVLSLDTFFLSFCRFLRRYSQKDYARKKQSYLCMATQQLLHQIKTSFYCSREACLQLQEEIFPKKRYLSRYNDHITLMYANQHVVRCVLILFFLPVLYVLISTLFSFLPYFCYEESSDTDSLPCSFQVKNQLMQATFIYPVISKKHTQNFAKNYNNLHLL